MTEPTTDQTYAYALFTTLTKVSSPATVGLYSSCQDRINIVLKQMEAYMDLNNDDRRKPKCASPCGGFLGLVFRMLFFRPVWTKEKHHHQDIRFIRVHFSAWHFAGSDLLWAGIAIRLFQTMQMSFGKLKIALYRVAQHDEEEEYKDKVEKKVSKDWDPRKICCFPLWSFVLIVSVLLAGTLVWLSIIGFFSSENMTFDGGLNFIQSLFVAVLGVPTASFLMFILPLVKNLIFCQEMSIRRCMDNDRISSKMGFMNEVRKEIWFLTRFIQFMEVFERRRICVVLKITNLDRCDPPKIVAVLEAINILLSDQESPFISILAVNPCIILEKVNFADGCLCKEDRAHALLNRIVTLPLTIPPLSKDLKCTLFRNLTTRSKFLQNIGAESSDVPLVAVKSKSEESKYLFSKPSKSLDDEKEFENSVLNILKSSEKKLSKYMVDDAVSMRRVISSIWVSVVLMKALKLEFPKADDIAAWVVLANQWPCRLSWIIQCVEDVDQREAIDGDGTGTNPSKILWEVFTDSMEELYIMSAQIEDLLEHDGDPELFENLLNDKEFKFTINNLKIFQMVMVNLDNSIQKELAQIRGISRLKDSNWMRNLAPLPITSIIKMSNADICREMKRMEFDLKYITTVKDNKLNGSALIFGDADDLKTLLGMTFGEWASFKLHFLSLPSHLEPQYNNRLSLPTHSKSQRSKLFRIHHDKDEAQS